MGEERVSLTAVVMPTSADVVAYVAKNPQAIGYVSRAEVKEWIVDGPSEETAAADAAANQTVNPVAHSSADPPAVKVLRMEKRLPLRAALRSQEYALTNPLYLVSNGQPSGRVSEFLDFALSPAGQAIVNHYSAPIR